MSEEILKALTQLFAIITKQDGGVTEKERDFVIKFFQQQLNQDQVKEYVKLYDKFADYGVNESEGDNSGKAEDGEKAEKKERKLTSVKDSVKTLAICKKINKTLTQPQKAIALIKLLELVCADKNFTPQRMQIIDTVSEVFNIGNQEYKIIESFVLSESSVSLDSSDILIVSSAPDALTPSAKHIRSEMLEGEIIFLKISSVDMYFVKYIGDSRLSMNGFTAIPGQVYLFSPGSTIKAPKGDPLYYADIVSNFMSAATFTTFSFNAKDVEFKFPNGAIGLRDINIAEGPGRLIAIMGASGAGKTTLLNVLAGLEKPSAGEVLINGINLHKEKERIQGMIGYIAQDDLLIEELSVYENLFYNAKLCFKDLSEEEIHARVMSTLENLGLAHIKHLKVGNVLNKKISGGQRKRLNIALELIREPAVMFVDEPTSGLSSRDSENVIDLLKELSLKGKLIFVVIHQPSSDIYKMFDKIFIMDTGGIPIFFGHPVEAVTYFKRATNQIDSDRGQCHSCGNVNPEQIFNIIEARVVDEYGQFTNARKVTPKQWSELFDQNFSIEHKNIVEETPSQTLSIPSRLKQFLVFTTRDMLSKISNTQYMVINLLEAPLLALLLAFIIRYQNSPTAEGYMFRYNDNIPAFMLMSVIVALFMGLTVSAEEIIRDRKILRREAFLNLSRSSYLFSKLAILFLLSAIQTFTFVFIGNSILGIEGMTLSYWLVLFTMSCFANILGLNISATFNSAVTIYILIPLLLIPQMILSGAIFNFDKLNDTISSKGKVPFLADMMASRWAYEAITVDQYKNNRYQKLIFDIEKEESKSDFNQVYLFPELLTRLESVRINYKDTSATVRNEVVNKLTLLRNELNKPELLKYFEGTDLEKALTIEHFNEDVVSEVSMGIESVKEYHTNRFNKANEMKDGILSEYENSEDKKYTLTELKNKYFNETLAEVVRNINTKNKLIEHENTLIQQIDPVYNDPKAAGALDYRAHFYASQKHLFGHYFDTYYFNILIIWLMTVALYITLYFETLKKTIDLFEKISYKLPGAELLVPVKDKFVKIVLKIAEKIKSKASTENRKKKNREKELVA
jgi:ABC-type multidrug transport system ATPase subunit